MTDEPDDQIRNRTRAPQLAIVPDFVLDSPEFNALPATAIRVYLQLWRCAGKGRVFPGKRTIAKRAHVSNVSNVRRALRQIVDAGLVEITPRFGPGGRQTSNLYDLLDPPSVLRSSTSDTLEGVADDTGEGVADDTGEGSDREVGNDTPRSDPMNSKEGSAHRTSRGAWRGPRTGTDDGDGIDAWNA